MRNKLLILAIVLLPPALFVFFWLNPVRDTKPDSETNSVPSAQSNTNAPVDSPMPANSSNAEPKSIQGNSQ